MSPSIFSEVSRKVKKKQTLQSHKQQRQANMITDDQLGVFANVMGVLIFFLIIVYHYVTAARKVRCLFYTSFTNQRFSLTQSSSIDRIKREKSKQSHITLYLCIINQPTSKIHKSLSRFITPPLMNHSLLLLSLSLSII